MNTATTIAIVAIMAALVFVGASYFVVMKAFAQRNPTPSPNSHAYYNGCVLRQSGGTHAAFCYHP